MNHKFSILLILLIFFAFTSECMSQIENTNQQNDWLIKGDQYISKVILSSNGKDLLISNGIVEKSFRITPNFAGTAIKNLVSGQNYLRAVRPEAQITVNGQKIISKLMCMAKILTMSYWQPPLNVYPLLPQN